MILQCTDVGDVGDVGDAGCRIGVVGDLLMRIVVIRVIPVLSGCSAGGLNAS